MKPLERSLFRVDCSEYLKRHDIVYRSPPSEGYEGFPLGNGDLGAMVWCDGEHIKVQINKNDAFDQPGTESGMLLRSCARMVLDLGVPVFDWLYLDDFGGRLSLATAEASLSATTPFLALTTEAFIRADRNVFVLSCRAEGRGDLADHGATIRARVERWGSRGLGWWYSGVAAGAEHGLGHARAGATGRDVWLRESFGGLDFAVACRLVSVGGAATSAQVVHSRGAELSVGPAGVQEFAVLVSVVTSNESTRLPEDAIDLLDETECSGIDATRARHRSWWADFWSKSFVHIGDDYLENLYYFHLYLMGSSSRGRYPVMFNAGLWTWNRDVRQWCCPHHWNMQQAYWSVCTANHPELMEPYLETYWRLSAHAEKYAESRGFPGAILWNEKHDYAGRMLDWDSPSFVHTFTPGAQIGQYFWDYFLFTGDGTFLRGKAYPFMKKAAQFYLQYLQWDEAKGEYFIYPASPYESESGNDFRNTVTDLASIRACFSACIQASELLELDSDLRARWGTVLNRLAPYPILRIPGQADMIAIAEDKEGRVIELGERDYIFCTTTAPVFPAGVLGIADKGSALYEAASRRVEKHPELRVANPVAIVAARLGLAEESYRRLSMSIRLLQHFPQGFFYNLEHWYRYSRYCGKVSDDWIACQRDYLNDRACRYPSIPVRGTGQRVSAPMWPFIQCGLEPLAILAATVNEMLLQSHEGVIRIFPATPPPWQCAFTLRARGGFLVSAEKPPGEEVGDVFVESLHRGVCRLVNPWPGEHLSVAENDGDDYAPRGRPVAFKVGEKDVVEFPTAEGAVYRLRPARRAQRPALRFGATANEAPKRFQEASLGKDRDF